MKLNRKKSNAHVTHINFRKDFGVQTDRLWELRVSIVYGLLEPKVDDQYLPKYVDWMEIRLEQMTPYKILQKKPIM